MSLGSTTGNWLHINRLLGMDVSLSPDIPTLLCDKSRSQPHQVVPSRLQGQVLNKLHSFSHPSIQATQCLIGYHFIWYNMCYDVDERVHAVPTKKVIIHHHSPVEWSPVPDEPFTHIHNNPVSPFPSSHGFTHLMKCVNKSTWLHEAIPLASTTTEVYGICTTSLLTGLCNLTMYAATSDHLGVMLQLTSMYHAQTNGLIESLHRTLKAAVHTGHHSDWLSLMGPGWPVDCSKPASWVLCSRLGSSSCSLTSNWDGSLDACFAQVAYIDSLSPEIAVLVTKLLSPVMCLFVHARGWTSSSTSSALMLTFQGGEMSC